MNLTEFGTPEVHMYTCAWSTYALYSLFFILFFVYLVGVRVPSGIRAIISWAMILWWRRLHFLFRQHVYLKCYCVWSGNAHDSLNYQTIIRIIVWWDWGDYCNAVDDKMSSDKCVTWKQLWAGAIIQQER